MHVTRSRFLWILCVACCLLGTTVHGASLSIPYSTPGERELETPAPRQDDGVAPSIELPMMPLPAQDAAAPAQFYLMQVTFTGNTVFADAELLAVVKPYLHRNITSAELQRIRIDLSKYYVDHGYINSGVIIPDQKIDQGTLHLEVIEGELSVIQLSGQDRLHYSYLYDRILLGVDKPLNIKSLQNQLFLLQQDIRINRINAQLQPGDRQGESILYVDVDEAQALHVQLIANNHRPPSVGAGQGVLELTHSNVTGMGDTVDISYGLTEGLNDYFVHYEYPLTARNTRLVFYYEDTDSDVVEEPFASLGVASQTTTLGVGIGSPLFTEVDSELIIGVNLEKRKSQTYLLGVPFSFEPGPQDGLSRVSLMRIYQSWFQRDQSSVIALRSTFNFGFDVMDATVNDGVIPDSKFQSWLGQFQWLKNLPNRTGQFLARANLQLTDDALLPMEQFSVGGANSVRGYRENQIVGDAGVFASLEYRYPLIEQPANHLQSVLFADYGQVRNTDRETPALDSIYSIGLGLRWAYKNIAETQIYWGHALHDAGSPGNDLQDDGWHFQFKWGLY